MRIGLAPADCYHLELPCGKCIGCKLDRARMWSVRIVHEAQFFDSNLFLTLTYDREHLAPSWSLEYPDFSGFMKRLRKRVVGVGLCPNGRKSIRFFCAGEYGGQSGRPHFHCILFNCFFPDQERLANGTFRSVLCEDLWRCGNVVIGDVNARSAAYVAGYTLKKRHGAGAAEHYEDVLDSRTGELSSRRPEFVVMSRRPGIGSWWYDRFKDDLFPGDTAVSEGKCYKVPRYYWERFKLEADAGVVEEVAYRRELKAAEQIEDSSPSRRFVREVVAEKRASMFGERSL